MTPYDLRGYQREAVEACRREFAQGNRSVLVTLPTGTGKTDVGAELARQWPGNVLIITHLLEILNGGDGLLAKIANRCQDDRIGIVQSRRFNPQRITVASLQSLVGPSAWRLEALLKSTAPTLVVIDEAHHATRRNAYGRVLSRIKAASGTELCVMGMTATPWREDGSVLRDLFPTQAFRREMWEMQEVLCPVEWRSVDLGPLAWDLAGTPARGWSLEERWDWNGLATGRNLRDLDLMGATVQKVLPSIEGRPTVVFASSINHSKELAAEFRRQGASAEHVDSYQPKGTRRDVIERWRRDEIQIVCNVGVLAEGFDRPALSAAVIARPTASKLLLVQIMGRVSRRHESKADAIVLDVARNTNPLPVKSPTPNDIVAMARPRRTILKGPSETSIEYRLRLNVLRETKLQMERYGETDRRPAALSVNLGKGDDGRNKIGLLLPDDDGEDALWKAWLVNVGRGPANPEPLVDGAPSMSLNEAVGSMELHAASPLSRRGTAWRGGRPHPGALRTLAGRCPELAGQAKAEKWNQGLVSDHIHRSYARPVITRMTGRQAAARRPDESEGPAGSPQWPERCPTATVEAVESFLANEVKAERALSLSIERALQPSPKGGLTPRLIVDVLEKARNGLPKDEKWRAGPMIRDIEAGLDDWPANLREILYSGSLRLEWLEECQWCKVPLAPALELAGRPGPNGVWARSHSHLCREHSTRSGNGSHTPAEWLAMRERQAWKCGYCDRPTEPPGSAQPLAPTAMTKDHVHALARGGSDDIGNIIGACWACNRRKGAMLVAEFIQLLGETLRERAEGPGLDATRATRRAGLTWKCRAGGGDGA